MPPKAKFCREEIVNAALATVREGGMSALNARAIASKLGSSTQPLFSIFSSMDDIRTCIFKRARALYADYISRGEQSCSRLYKGAGMAYVRFAHEERQLFRLLFMRDRVYEGTDSVVDGEVEHIYDAIMSATGFDRSTATRFHTDMWVFAHGLATMVATGYVQYDEAAVSRLLSEQFLALRDYYEKHAEDIPPQD